jgi:hypothetical protein
LIDDKSIIDLWNKMTLWTRPLWLDPLTWLEWEDDRLDLYEYVIRLPLYVTWWQINFQMISGGWQWTIDRVRIGVNGEPIDLFGYNNIL